jgi:hypothetical protein
MRYSLFKEPESSDEIMACGLVTTDISKIHIYVPVGSIKSQKL